MNDAKAEEANEEATQRRGQDAAEGPQASKEEAQLALVTWVDSVIWDGGWNDLDDLDIDEGLVPIQSVGYVHADTVDYLVLVPHMSRSRSAACARGAGSVMIPKTAIVQRRTLSA